MANYLGLDSSTQGISAVVIDTHEQGVVFSECVNYGSDLPQYNSPFGILPSEDPLVKCSDPLMWLEALELLFQRMRDRGLDFSTIDGIGGCAQQHGTIYLRPEFKSTHWLDGAASLKDAVAPLLVRKVAPTWMDSSTFDECRAIDAAFGGGARVREVTGSCATERFAGPQIRKFYLTDPNGYSSTGVIHLISSFMCSMLIGRSAPVDYADASGMNLLNLKTCQWERGLLEATAPELSSRLPVLEKPAAIAGALHPFWRKYGFREQVAVTVWSGDNLNSLLGVGAWKPGCAVISLGTSDTYFSAMDKVAVDPEGYGHVFVNPAEGYMSLICFKNGSIARERIKDQFNMTWSQFDNDAFELTRPGNGGCMMLPYFTSEITPLVLNAKPFYRGNSLFEAQREPSSIVRALVEAQAMSMRIHSQWIGSRPKRLRLTGGASKSAGICQVFADVFNATVERHSLKNSADFGAALSAAHSIGGYDWGKLTKMFCGCDASQTVRPIEENVEVYSELLGAFEAFEKDITG